jgi:hypothetical protein
MGFAGGGEVVEKGGSKGRRKQMKKGETSMES